MSFSIIPAAFSSSRIPKKPYFKAASVQRSVYFGEEPNRKLSKKEIGRIIGEAFQHDSIVRKEMKFLSIANVCIPFAGLVGAFYALGLAGLLNQLTIPLSGGGAYMLFKMLQHESTQNVADRALVRESKAEQLQPQMDYVTPESLDGLLAKAETNQEMVFLYLPKGQDNAGDARMYDLFSDIETLATKQKTKVRFIRYDLGQKGHQPAFNLPPTDLPASEYPCLAVLDKKGRVALEAEGLLNWTPEKLLNTIYPVFARS